jgi:hypothetical protein
LKNRHFRVHRCSSPFVLVRSQPSDLLVFLLVSCWYRENKRSRRLSLFRRKELSRWPARTVARAPTQHLDCQSSCDGAKSLIWLLRILRANFPARDPRFRAVGDPAESPTRSAAHAAARTMRANLISSTRSSRPACAELSAASSTRRLWRTFSSTPQITICWRRKKRGVPYPCVSHSTAAVPVASPSCESGFLKKPLRYPD